MLFKTFLYISVLLFYRSKDGLTPVHIAAAKGRLDFLKAVGERDAMLLEIKTDRYLMCGSDFMLEDTQNQFILSC
jgi:hypothetical protein